MEHSREQFDWSNSTVDLLLITEDKIVYAVSSLLTDLNVTREVGILKQRKASNYMEYHHPFSRIETFKY